MSYQEIYGGLNKKASTEQVKKLAFMIKQAGMKKKAAPAWLQALFTGGVKMPSGIIDKTWKIGAPARFIGGQLSKHPTAAKVLGGTALASIPSFAAYAVGNSGKADLRQNLAKANQKVKNLTAENEKLNNRGVWDLISENFGKFWQWLSDYFSGKQGNKPDTNTQGTK